MPRQKTEFGKEVEGRIIARMKAGGTAHSISAELTAEGIKGASPATVGRRMKELRGKVRARRPTSPPAAPKRARAAPEPEDWDDEDDDDGPPLPFDVVDLPKKLAEMQKHAQTAVRKGDLALYDRINGKIIQALKAMPAAPPDPNASPDLIKRAKLVVEKLHAMIDVEAKAAHP